MSVRSKKSKRRKAVGGGTICAPPELMDGTREIGHEALKWDHFILGLKKTTKEFIENVLENIIESIVITDIDGHLIFFNKFSEEIFGYRAEEVINRHIVVLGAREPDVLGCIRRNELFNGEIVLKKKGGRPFPARVRCVPLRDEQDQPIAMVGVASDLTREKEKERIAQEVARLKAFNENVIASLNDGIQIIDPQGKITFVNRRMEELMGYEPGDLVGLHYSNIVIPEGQSHFRELIDAEGTVPGRTTFETSFTTKSGKNLPFLVGASPLKDGQRLVGIVAAVTDISEIQALKEELFHSEKMSLVGTLASEVAHEINNPLGGLIMAVQMLIKDLEVGQFSSRAFLEEIREIETDAKRCKKITQQLLDFSRAVPEERTLLNINKVIEDALLLVQRQAELENISFSKAYDEALPLVKANPSSLQQVIINLVKNAKDAMPEGGSIKLCTEKRLLDHDDWVCVSISDTGHGIPAQIADHIFNSFFTTKGKGKGTGLGLAVSRRIVEEYGGSISFKSLPSSGTVFEILFPQAGKNE